MRLSTSVLEMSGSVATAVARGVDFRGRISHDGISSEGATARGGRSSCCVRLIPFHPRAEPKPLFGTRGTILLFGVSSSQLLVLFVRCSCPVLHSSVAVNGKQGKKVKIQDRIGMLTTDKTSADFNEWDWDATS